MVALNHHKPMVLYQDGPLCLSMRHIALLSDLSNQPHPLYHCQIPTFFTAAEVIGTKSHLIALQSCRVKVEIIVLLQALLCHIAAQTDEI